MLPHSRVELEDTQHVEGLFWGRRCLLEMGAGRQVPGLKVMCTDT